MDTEKALSDIQLLHEPQLLENNSVPNAIISTVHNISIENYSRWKMTETYKKECE